jgi:FHS family glucose/mannose:H+ symporter-like MFS transporter
VERRGGRVQREFSRTARGAALAPRSFAAGELPLTALLVLLYFCYVGTEVSIVNYLPATFVERLRASNFIASLSVTAYWLTMVVGRLVAGALAERMTYYRYLIWSTIGMIGALSALPVTRGVPAAFVIVLLLGLLMSGMAAVALIFATRLLPPEKTEQTASLLIAAGGLGGALMPLIVGKLMDLFTAQAALWFFCGGALLQLMLLVVSARMKRLQPERGKA